MKNFTNKVVAWSSALSIALCAGCIGQPFKQGGEKDKSVIKYEQLKTTTVEMFNYSTAYSETPTFVIARKGSEKTTICKTTNMTDFDLDKDTLWLCFQGAPRLYNQDITINKMLFNEKIIAVDTTGR